MANLPVISSPVTINTADNYIIGEGSRNTASTCTIQLTNSSFSGTGVVVKGRKAGSTAAFVAIPYINRATDASATAAVNAAAVLKVDCTGLQVSLDNTTGYTSGALVADFDFTLGVAAR